MIDPRLNLTKDLLPALLAGEDPRLGFLRNQFAGCGISIRSETNWGFFADFKVSESAQRVSPPDFCGGEAAIEVKGMRTPAGCILYVEDGLLSYLEVYTVDSPWEHPPTFLKTSGLKPIIPGERVKGAR